MRHAPECFIHLPAHGAIAAFLSILGSQDLHEVAASEDHCDAPAALCYTHHAEFGTTRRNRMRKLKFIVPIAITCLVAAMAFGQAKGIAGKWGTAAAPGAGVVMLDLKVDATNKVTGSITEYGNALCGSPDTNLKIDS